MTLIKLSDTFGRGGNLLFAGILPMAALIAAASLL